MTGETSYAYRVERSKFDKILLDHARRVGVDVREEHAVSDLICDDSRVRGVTYADADGGLGEIRAKYVADASGNKSRIYRGAGGTWRYSEFFWSLARSSATLRAGKRLPDRLAVAGCAGPVRALAFGV
jgi:FAD-dependent halogenase